MRAALESLLRSRKLDVTLTTAAPWAETPPERLAPTGCADLDTALGGGLRRGHPSQSTGAPSRGRPALGERAVAAATARGRRAARRPPRRNLRPPAGRAGR